MGDYCLLYRLSINFFLALISMNIRILSGFLFLLAAVVTIPLVFLVVTLIIPILFFIIAIMMFARRNKVETVPYYNDDYGQPYYDEREYYDHHEPHSRPRDDYYEEDYHQGYYDEYEQPRDEKENRNTRRQLRKERRQKKHLKRNNMNSHMIIILIMTTLIENSMRKQLINIHNFLNVL